MPTLVSLPLVLRIELKKDAVVRVNKLRTLFLRQAALDNPEPSRMGSGITPLAANLNVPLRLRQRCDPELYNRMLKPCLK
ncbi:hypothetical protein LGM00_07700 [Klebsiella pneumoniae]|uniref:hypothetical protein n=1 Tax=Klebsiella pneumoniae TaxID=573 RepID=UPI001CFCC28B|nr:hypothetical protein [Klebsiella pneumoniae]UDD24729.1 hypothetical protein LGM00_07700 [Klebsiella pneumoniae]